MTLWKIGGRALIRAATSERAKAILVERDDDPSWLEADVEIVREQGQEEIVLSIPAKLSSRTRKRATL
jgi:hypothetical protein